MAVAGTTVLETLAPLTETTTDPVTQTITTGFASPKQKMPEFLAGMLRSVHLLFTAFCLKRQNRKHTLLQMQE